MTDQNVTSDTKNPIIDSDNNPAKKYRQHHYVNLDTEPNLAKAMRSRPPLHQLSGQLFPPAEIFTITQCLDRDVLTTASSEGGSTLRSSLVTQLGDDHALYYLHGLPETDEPQVALAELLPLPIPAEMRERLAFEENLLVSRFVGEIHREKGLHQPILDFARLDILGGMATRVRLFSDDLFSLISTAHFTVDAKSHVGGLWTVEASCDNSLRLHKERRNEALCRREGHDTLYLNVKLNRPGDQYNVQAIRKFGDECERRSGSFASASVEPNFLTDGVGLLFARYAVLQRFVGTVRTVTASIHGRLCRSDWRFTRKANRVLCDRVCTVWKVRRTVWTHGESYGVEPDVSISVYLETGHLVRHTWASSRYVVHMAPHADVQRLLKMMPERAEDEVDERWQTNDELREKFLDMQLDRLIDLRAFMHASETGGVMVQLMRDYLFCLLRAKPVNVLAWTAEYFASKVGQSVPEKDIEYEIVSEE